MLIEVLPSLPLVIPFDSLESCLDRAALYQPADPGEAPSPES